MALLLLLLLLLSLTCGSYRMFSTRCKSTTQTLRMGLQLSLATHPGSQEAKLC